MKFAVILLNTSGTFQRQIKQLHRIFFPKHIKLIQQRITTIHCTVQIF